MNIAPSMSDQKCGIGYVIRTPGSSELISDVVIEPFTLWPDDRGYFLEIARIGQGRSGALSVESAQVSAALSYPGTIKAFHIHKKQTDLWIPAAGMFQVALVDLREDSPTYAVRNTLYCGTLKTWKILIPPGVAHGYKIIGADPGILVYLTDRHYDPSDEGRIPYDDSQISYDWETQHK